MDIDAVSNHRGRASELSEPRRLGKFVRDTDEALGSSEKPSSTEAFVGAGASSPEIVFLRLRIQLYDERPLIEDSPERG